MVGIVHSRSEVKSAQFLFDFFYLFYSWYSKVGIDSYCVRQKRKRPILNKNTENKLKTKKEMGNRPSRVLNESNSVTSGDVCSVYIETKRGIQPLTIKDGKAYCKLPDNTEYRIVVKNLTCKEAQFELFIDQKKRGGFHSRPKSTFSIERPDDGYAAGYEWEVNSKNEQIYRKFCFKREASRAAQAAGVVAGANENGLIQVNFACGILKPSPKPIAVLPKSKNEKPSQIKTIKSMRFAGGLKVEEKQHFGAVTVSSASAFAHFDQAVETHLDETAPIADDAPAIFYVGSVQDLDEMSIGVVDEISASPPNAFLPTAKPAVPLTSGATVPGGKSHQSFNSRVTDIFEPDESTCQSIYIRLVVDEELSPAPDAAIVGAKADPRVPPRIDDFTNTENATVSNNTVG